MIGQAYKGIRWANNAFETFRQDARLFLRKHKSPTNLLHPITVCGVASERVCFLIADDAEAAVVNRLKRDDRARGLTYAAHDRVAKPMHAGFRRRPLSDVGSDAFDVYVFPTTASQDAFFDVLEGSRRNGQLFGIWDHFNYWPEYEDFGVPGDPAFVQTRYRSVDLHILWKTGVLPPSHFGNYAGINYIKDRFVGPGMDVLDMFAGSGCIGFSLKNETDIGSVAFADANFGAVTSIRETMKHNAGLSGSVWLSDVFSGVPNERKFHLIVANPPYGPMQFKTMRLLANEDPGWSAHRQFLDEAHGHLHDDGIVSLVHGDEAADMIVQYLADSGTLEIHGVETLPQKNVVMVNIKRRA